MESKAKHQQAFKDLKQYLMSALVMSSLICGKLHKLYVSTFEDVIGCLLAQDNDANIESAIFYLSRLLNYIEQKYLIMEKLYLSLHYSYINCQKTYFQLMCK